MSDHRFSEVEVTVAGRRARVTPFLYDTPSPAVHVLDVPCGTGPKRLLLSRLLCQVFGHRPARTCRLYVAEKCRWCWFSCPRCGGARPIFGGGKKRR